MSTTPETTLKNCPFCGGMPKSEEGLVYCENDKCYAIPGVPEEHWNTRAGSGEHSDQGGGAMTKEEARLILLEQAVEESQNKIEFMHGCLTEKGYSYGYPDSTLEFLKELAALVPRDEGCGHSVTKENCESCQRGVKWRRDRFNALAVLAAPSSTDEAAQNH